MIKRGKSGAGTKTVKHAAFPQEVHCKYQSNVLHTRSNESKKKRCASNVHHVKIFRTNRENTAIR